MKHVTWLRGILCALVGVAFAAVAAAQTSQPTACGWNPDSNGDYLVTVADLLALLSVFEEADADMDGIFDSMDDCVGTYDACGICNGSGVDVDADVVCDDVDPCVGALDVCGVCNGPGPSVPVIDEIVFVTDSIYVQPTQQWYVFSYAVDTLYTYVCPVQGCTDANAANFNPLAVIEDGTCSYGPAQCGGASTVTFDGHTYELVAIGNQCWFKENLRSDNYRNGDLIPGNLSDGQWTIATSGAHAVYGEGTSLVWSGSSDEVVNLATYGRLYNWYAVNDARGLCPVGFHVPFENDWTILEDGLGGSNGAGAALKSSAADSPPWNGTNSAGFSALPGGARRVDGKFQYGANYGFWWTCEAFNYGAGRYMYSANSAVTPYSAPIREGFSVRCLRDEGFVCLDPDNDGICSENEVSGCTDNNAANFNPSATEDDGSCVQPAPIQCGGVSTVSFDDFTYTLVGIGNQCWFKENLRSDNYRNGDPITGNVSSTEWILSSSGASAVFNNSEANFLIYGRLYNWHAVNDGRGLCPVGFHVPTDSEWTELEIAVGGSALAGMALKSSAADAPPWDGSNNSGFSALASGYRNYEGNAIFNGLGVHGYWWSSSPSGPDAWSRYLGSGYSNMLRNYSSVRNGFSVRCIGN